MQDLLEKTDKLREKTRDIISDTWESFSSLAIEKRVQADFFLYKQETKLRSTLREIDENLREHTDRAGEPLRETRKQLDQKTAELSAEIEKLKSTRAENWDEAKKAVRKKWEEAQGSLKSLRSQL